MATELIGWLSAMILLATLARQVYTQYRERTVAGVSHWLFVGQVLASIGFIVYSALVKNWVFVVTNSLILVTALVGQVVVMRNQKLDNSNGGGQSNHRVVRVSRKEFRAGRGGGSRGPRVG